MDNKEIKFKDVLEHIDRVFDLYEERFNEKVVKFNLGEEVINLYIGKNDIRNYIRITTDESDQDKYDRLDNFLRLEKLFDSNIKNYGMFVGLNSHYFGIVSPNHIEASDVFILYVNNNKEAILLDINGYNKVENKELYDEIFVRFAESKLLTYKEPIMSKIFKR
jgi:hypothetical protein